MLKKFKLIFGIKAEDDFDEVFGHYEELRKGLGEEFDNTLTEQLELLRTQPEMYAKYNKFARKGNMKKFPYSFYYQEDIPQKSLMFWGYLPKPVTQKPFKKNSKGVGKNNTFKPMKFSKNRYICT